MIRLQREMMALRSSLNLILSVNAPFLAQAVDL